jgi:hypothetical protein
MFLDSFCLLEITDSSRLDAHVIPPVSAICVRPCDRLVNSDSWFEVTLLAHGRHAKKMLARETHEKTLKQEILSRFSRVPRRSHLAKAGV